MNDTTTGFDPAALGLPVETTQEEAGAWKDEAPAAEAPAADAPEPAAEAPAAPEAGPVAAEPADPAKPAAPPKGYVPTEALEQERVQRKAEAQRVKELEARLRAMEEAQRQPAPPPPQPVDPLVDPEGHQRFLAHQAAQVDALRQQFAERDHFERVRTAVATAEASFLAAKPDYYAAADHLMKVRERELQAWRLPAHEVAEQIRREAREIAENAVRAGLNPAEIVYEMAAARGYAPKAPETAERPATPPPADAMKAHAQAAQATASLPPGGGAPKPLTVAAAADLSESDLMRLPQKELDRLLRGG